MIGAIAAAARLEQKVDAGSAGGSTAKSQVDNTWNAVRRAAAAVAGPRGLGDLLVAVHDYGAACSAVAALGQGDAAGSAGDRWVSVTGDAETLRRVAELLEKRGLADVPQLLPGTVGLAAAAGGRIEPVYAAAGTNRQQAQDAARYRLLRDWWFGMSLALGPEDLRGALTPGELDAKLDEGLRRRAGP